MASAPPIFDLLLTLPDVESPVWRMLRVSSGATLARAQRLICVCFGWAGGRPFSFHASGVQFESARRNGELSEIRLRQLLPDLGSELEFEYGEKSTWLVHARVARVHARDGVMQWPVCVGGEGIAPPLNAGGAFAWNERAEAGVDDGASDGATPSARAITVKVPLDLINAELDLLR